ncbi:MAG: hypothetical protein JO041_04640, partial [Acidobacteria bacterium]|nr:hypothetical protein [Acidobacteriota bacterium]
MRPLGAQLAGTGAERDEEARLQRLVESRHWDAARFEKATGWDVPRFRNFLDTVCRPYAADYARFPTNSADAGDGYYLNNGWFDGVDAEVLYSIIRHTAPATIVEVGSGNSTRLMRRAIREGSASTRIISIDPQPRADVHAFCDEHIPQPVERLRQEDIAARLSPGDILFID